jgi:phage terminase large subunit-like protein
VTYAGFAGESTVLEALYQRGLQQPLVASDLHAGDGILMFWSHVPIAPWQTEAWLAEMGRSLRPNAYLRMIENRFVTTESTFIDMAWWDACVDPQATPIITDRMLSVWIGVDTSVKRDSTAIVAVHWDRKAQKARLVWHRIYQPLPDQPIDFEVAIEDTIRDLHKRYRVRGVLYDPYQMQASAQRLRREGVPIEGFPQSASNLTEASQNLYELIKGGNLVAYPDAAVRLAVSRAVAVETARGWRIAKDKQSHKIDVVVALGMAALAAVRAQSESTYHWKWVDDIGGAVPEQFTGRRLLPWGGMPLICRG